MTAPVRILYVEDNPQDAELVLSHLEANGIACEALRVETREEFLAALERGGFDLILSDFSLPTFDGLTALTLAQTKGGSVPFICISGTIGEETAVMTLRCGATDYLLKNRLERLPNAVQRALQEAAQRAERQRLEEDLREAQERFRGIYASAKDAIGYATLEGRWVDANPAFEALTGYTREELLTKTYQDLTPPEDQQEEALIIRSVLNTGQPAEYEKEYVRKDGSRVPVAVTTFLAVGGHQKPAGLAAIIKDMSERKRLEAQYRQAQKMEAVGQLAGGIAHDFNNLLTVILGYCDLALAQLGPAAPVSREIQHVKAAGERAAALTRQLLAFSRRQVFTLQVLDLQAVVRNLEPLLRRLIGEDIDLVVQVDQPLGRVKADPGQIEQVVMNLAVNARDAMPTGGQLTIEMRNVELDNGYARLHVSVQPGPYVMLTMSDTGCGMDAETQARIFEPFFTTKGPGRGTGLGLATVYGIVKQSGAHIWVYSEVGQGTTFKLYFPRIKDSETTLVATEPLASPGHVRGTETILLVEDEAMIRELAASVLREQGYTVLTARDGAEALRLSAEHHKPIHLLVTDVVMPGGSGREVVERVMRARPSLKILYMSGYTDDVIVRHGVLEAGLPFLEKPFRPEALLRRVREILDKSVE